MSRKSMLHRVILIVFAAAAPLVLIAVSLAGASASFPQLTRITDSPPSGDNYNPTISGNGKVIAFNSNVDFLNPGITGTHEIWLYDTNTLTFTRVTTATSSDRWSCCPTLSADGTKVAFEGNADLLNPEYQFEIWLYDAATLTMTRVTTASGEGVRSSRSASLSGDGSKLTFRSDSDFLGQGIQPEQNEIWLYDVETQVLSRITTASDSERSSEQPELNYDGTKIVFRSDSDFLGQGIQPEQNEIWLYDTTTMSLTRVTSAPDGRGSAWPSLNASGTKIAFSSGSDFLGQGIAEEQFEVWLYDTVTMSLIRVTTASDSDRVSTTPSLNATGTKIAFSSDSDFFGQGIAKGQREVWLYDTGTMSLTRVTTATADNRDSWLNGLSPTMSADARRLVLASDSDFLGQGIPDNQFEIWLAQLAPEPEKKLVYLPSIIK